MLLSFKSYFSNKLSTFGTITSIYSSLTVIKGYLLYFLHIFKNVSKSVTLHTFPSNVLLCCKARHCLVVKL